MRRDTVMYVGTEPYGRTCARCGHDIKPGDRSAMLLDGSKAHVECVRQ